MILHLLGIAVLVYIVLVIIFPHYILSFTVVAIVAIWNWLKDLHFHYPG